MTLVAESKVSKCIANFWGLDHHLEASGIIAVNKSLVINFDNLQVFGPLLLVLTG